MRLKKIVLFILLASLLFIAPIRHAVIPKVARAWFNIIFRDLYVDIWKGQLDVTMPGSIVNATISTSDTYRYAVFINCNINKGYITSYHNSMKFKGVIRYTIYHEGEVLESHDIRSSYGWRGWNGMPDNFWSEHMFNFWMPYNDKYDTITIEMEVLEADPSYLEKREVINWSVRGEWVP